MNCTDAAPSLRPVRRLCTCLALPLLVVGQCALAATIVVTRNDDPAPNGCLPGDCSLREAVAAANANVDPDLIQVPAANYGLPRGKLTLSGNVQIYGDTDATTKVEGDGTFPVFDIVGGEVKLTRLTIQGHGAHAIDSQSQANTILEYVTVPESDSEIWGGSPVNSNGSLDIRASEIHAYVSCGCLRDCLISDSALLRLQVGTGDLAQTRVRIERSFIDGDLAVAGSGLVIQTNDTVDLIDTVINHTDIGLLISAATPQSVSLDHVSYLGNDGPVDVLVPTTVLVINSEFTSNARDTFYAGPAAVHAGAGATLEIDRSSFVNNIGTGTVGGALLVEEAATMRIRNSTFSGNTFSAASADGARGAAIGFRSDTDLTRLIVQHVTIVAPTFLPVGLLGTAIGGEGGETGLVLNVFNSILRGTCSLDANAMDVATGNIESSADTCDLDPADNQVAVSSADLALGSLGDHGGPTPTRVPGPLSPAIDSADPAFCRPTDQRGYQRPFGDGCDVGAVEVGAEDRVFANGFD